MKREMKTETETVTPTDRETVFQTVYDRFAGRVFAYFSSGFGPDAAEDLTQQTFLNVWRYLCGWNHPEPDSWKAWIFHAARNVRNDFLRARLARPDPVPYDDALDPDADGPSADLVEQIAVRTAFRRLRPEDQDLLLYRANGLNSKEIGSILGRSASAVRSRMQQARDRFRAELADCGVCTDE